MSYTSFLLCWCGKSWLVVSRVGYTCWADPVESSPVSKTCLRLSHAPQHSLQSITISKQLTVAQNIFTEGRIAQDTCNPTAGESISKSHFHHDMLPSAAAAFAIYTV